MFRAMKLRQMEVISITNARRLGYIYDVEIKESDGSIAAIIVRKAGSFWGRLFGKGEHIIPWEEIEVYGRDLVLVRFDD